LFPVTAPKKGIAVLLDYSLEEAFGFGKTTVNTELKWIVIFKLVCNSVSSGTLRDEVVYLFINILITVSYREAGGTKVIGCVHITIRSFTFGLRDINNLE